MHAQLRESAHSLPEPAAPAANHARRHSASGDATDPATYRGSHRQLLRSLPDRSTRCTASDHLDAIAVSTSRSLADDCPGLKLAVQLAVRLDSVLLVLCSGNAQARDFPIQARVQLGDRLIVRDLPAAEQLRLPSLRSSRHRLSTFFRSTDIALKRNLALAFATMSQWSSLLFLDDDIGPCDSEQTLDVESVQRGLDAMFEDERLRAVGWSVEAFPDNSVIGHARRLAGLPQQTFVSGGALLLRCDIDVPFFPDIFNEDWLFLIATAQVSPDSRASIGYAGSVSQLAYDPFTVARARGEEIGDLVGEGLMNLLEDGATGSLHHGQFTPTGAAQ